MLYRVTPVFEGNHLLADGVIMEAMSVEDNGESIQFHVFVYNVQPGVVLNYATGENDAEGEAVRTAEPVQPTVNADESVQSQTCTYILNTNTHKFHVPSCSSVDDMKEKNKQEYTGAREDVIAQGYIPCKKCNP